MIENYLLEQFVAFAKCGTLLQTSKTIHVSQPALSRSMKKLENAFGVPLFHREKSKLSLNETGKVAAEYARRVLDAHQEMVEHVASFDRSLRTVSVGSCAPFPLNEVLPILQERMPGKTISAEIADDSKLISGLKNRTYQLCILHTNPNDNALFCQRFMREQLYISIASGHPLSEKDSVTFEDLKGIRILMNRNVGFWMDVCLEKLSASDLLIQDNPDALTELVEASDLPLFNSDQFIARGIQTPGRVSIPISNPEAYVSFRLVCLATEQYLYQSVFNTVRGNVLKKY